MVWFGLSFVSNFSCTARANKYMYTLNTAWMRTCMRSLIPKMPFYNLATKEEKNVACRCLLLVICTLSLCFVLFVCFFFILLVQAIFLKQQQQHGHILPEVTLSYVCIFYTHTQWIKSTFFRNTISFVWFYFTTFLLESEKKRC